MQPFLALFTLTTCAANARRLAGSRILSRQSHSRHRRRQRRRRLRHLHPRHGAPHGQTYTWQPIIDRREHDRRRHADRREVCPQQRQARRSIHRHVQRRIDPRPRPRHERHRLRHARARILGRAGARQSGLCPAQGKRRHQHGTMGVIEDADQVGRPESRQQHQRCRADHSKRSQSSRTIGRRLQGHQ